MDTAEDRATLFHAMADDSAAAVRAGWSHYLDRAFKAIENVTITICNHFEAFVIIISTKFTLSHTRVPFVS